MDPDRTPCGQNERKTNTKRKKKYEPIGVIRQNGLIQEDHDDDDDGGGGGGGGGGDQATCSYWYNFNNYMTNMGNRQTKIT